MQRGKHENIMHIRQIRHLVNQAPIHQLNWWPYKVTQNDGGPASVRKPIAKASKKKTKMKKKQPPKKPIQQNHDVSLCASDKKKSLWPSMLVIWTFFCNKDFFCRLFYGYFFFSLQYSIFGQWNLVITVLGVNVQPFGRSGCIILEF